MNLINKIIINFTCNQVGVDEFGNKYFEKKSLTNNEARIGKKKRFVIYRGDVEASKIPSNWHRWLHYTCDEKPVNVNTKKHSWQKIHLPNLTGTLYKHSPKNEQNQRKKVGADYQSWNPNS